MESTAQQGNNSIVHNDTASANLKAVSVFAGSLNSAGDWKDWKPPAEFDVNTQFQEGDPTGASSSLAVVDPAVVNPAYNLSSIVPVDSSGWTPTQSERAAAKQKLKMKDLVKIIRDERKGQNEFSEVTVEQIERVKMMHDNFMDGAILDFNYNTLLLVSSVIAGFGLVSNSSATIIASMLVSPIMGPVVALAYGTTICDWKMVKMAARNELMSLVFCVATGMIVAACTGKTELAESWLTSEMESRATLSNLLVAIPVAFFSGLGVAVSLLDSQTNSLVGVAISASLLPPAVNCGLIWVAFFFYDENDSNSVGADSAMTHEDFRQAAIRSLLVTIENIFLIWIASIFMFRMKEVLPIKKKIFWSDLGIARKIYRGKALIRESPEDLRVKAAATAANEEKTVSFKT